jgi:hypothetical protein
MLCRSQWPRGLRRGSAAVLTYWDCGFEYCCGAWICLLWVLCYQLQVSASGWSLIQRSPTECGVSECDREASMVRKSWPTSGSRAIKKNVSALTAIATTSTKWQILPQSLQFSYLAQLYKLCPVLWRPCVLFLWETPWLSNVTGMTILHVSFMLRTTSLSCASRLLRFSNRILLSFVPTFRSNVM